MSAQRDTSSMYQSDTPPNEVDDDEDVPTPLIQPTIAEQADQQQTTIQLNLPTAHTYVDPNSVQVVSVVYRAESPDLFDEPNLGYYEPAVLEDEHEPAPVVMGVSEVVIVNTIDGREFDAVTLQQGTHLSALQIAPRYEFEVNLTLWRSLSTDDPLRHNGTLGKLEYELANSAGLCVRVPPAQMYVDVKNAVDLWDDVPLYSRASRLRKLSARLSDLNNPHVLRIPIPDELRADPYTNCVAYYRTPGNTEEGEKQYVSGYGEVPRLYASKGNADHYVVRRLDVGLTFLPGHWPQESVYRRFNVPSLDQGEPFNIPMFYEGDEVFQPLWHAFFTILSMDIRDALLSVGCTTVYTIHDVIYSMDMSVRKHWFTNDYIMVLFDRMLHPILPGAENGSIPDNVYGAVIGLGRKYEHKDVGPLWTWVSGGKGPKEPPKYQKFRMIMTLLIRFGVRPIPVDCEDPELINAAIIDGWSNTLLDAFRRSEFYNAHYDKVYKYVQRREEASNQGYGQAQKFERRPDTNVGHAPMTLPDFPEPRMRIIPTERPDPPYVRRFRKEIVRFQSMRPGHQIEFLNDDKGYPTAIIDRSVPGGEILMDRKRANELVDEDYEAGVQSQSYGAVGEFTVGNPPNRYMQAYFTPSGQTMRNPIESYLAAPHGVRSVDDLMEFVKMRVHRIAFTIFEDTSFKDTDSLKRSFLVQRKQLLEAIFNEVGSATLAETKIRDSYLPEHRQAQNLFSEYLDRLRPYIRTLSESLHAIFGGPRPSMNGDEQHQQQPCIAYVRLDEQAARFNVPNGTYGIRFKEYLAETTWNMFMDADWACTRLQSVLSHVSQYVVSKISSTPRLYAAHVIEHVLDKVVNSPPSDYVDGPPELRDALSGYIQDIADPLVYDINLGHVYELMENMLRTTPDRTFQERVRSYNALEQDYYDHLVAEDTVGPPSGRGPRTFYSKLRNYLTLQIYGHDHKLMGMFQVATMEGMENTSELALNIVNAYAHDARELRKWYYENMDEDSDDED